MSDQREKVACLRGSIDACRKLKAACSTVFPGDVPHVTQVDIEELAEYYRAHLRAAEAQPAVPGAVPARMGPFGFDLFGESTANGGIESDASDLTLEKLERVVENFKAENPRAYAETQLLCALRGFSTEAIEAVTGMAQKGLLDGFKDPACFKRLAEAKKGGE